MTTKKSKIDSSQAFKKDLLVGQEVEKKLLASIQKKYPEVDIGSYPYFKEKPGTVLVLRSIKEDKLKMCEKEVRSLIKRLS